MKRKSARCSTGHGTGCTPPVELLSILGRDRLRVKRKQIVRRARRYPHGLKRGHATLNGPGALVRDERGRCVRRKSRDYHRNAPPSSDLNGFWRERLERAFGPPLGMRGTV